MATYVLVHGGGHGGWCYDRLAPLLRAKGHEVYAPTLTGLADRSHLLGPKVNLDTHITDVVNLIYYHDLKDVILAGHSYGGMVITGIADRAEGRVGRLVFLDAAHPHNGESLEDCAPTQMAFTKQRMRVVDGVELVVFPDAVQPERYGIRDPADVEWALARLTPHPWACFAQKLVLRDEAAVRRIPSVSVNCTETIKNRPPEFAHRCFEVDQAFEIDTGHDLMISEPAKLAEIMLQLV
jgi:pimeloyl-ACP methyl ester carboxylesterase